MVIEFTVAVILLLALVFLATIDMSFSQISDVGLRRIATDAEEQGKKRSADFLHEILENRPHFRFALSAAIQILLVAFSIFVALLVYRFYPTPREILLYSLVISIVLTVVFRQLIPRLLVGKSPETKLLMLLPLVHPLYRLWSLFAAPFSARSRRKEQQKIENTIVPETSEEKTTEDNNDDIHALMEVGKAEGIIEEEERELIETMVEFSDTTVDEIMTPRTEICALPIESTVRDARDLIIEEKYSRMPVFRENIDNIEGVIYVRDLLNAWSEGKEDESIENLLRPAFFVPETKSASELLKNMQLNHVQIAMVVDEYGGVAGVVTVEDIIEEIVGEIEDEDIEDAEIVEIIEGEGGYFHVHGSTEIGKIERLLEMEIEDDDFTTIAGLVTSEAGYVPKDGERLMFRGLEVEILQADEKKIYLLRLRKYNESESEETVEEIVNQ